MAAYTVTTVQWELGWELHILDEHSSEVGVTQVRDLADAEMTVRDFLALDDHPTPSSIEIRHKQP
jgi:hypothetical protein